MGRVRECREKKAFKYRKEADRFAFMLKRRYLDYASVYKCKYCSMYHLGHARSLRRRR